MNILEAINSRRSTKDYKSESVPRELIDKIIEAGTYAATGRGKQSPIIIAVTNKQMRDKLSTWNAEVLGVDTDPFYSAPVVLIVLADKEISTHIYDGSLVIGNMLLAAHSLGLGSCWIHRAKEVFDSSNGKEILTSLGITGNYEGIGHCVIGYPASDNPKPALRKENYIYYID